MEHNINEKVSLFSKSFSEMIATNDNSYNRNSYGNYGTPRKSYTRDEIERIIGGSSIASQQSLSRAYFDGDGFYKRIIIYYATLFKYVGMLIPNLSYGQKYSDNLKKKYYNALNYIEKMNLKDFFTRCSIRALVDGCYYGVIRKADKTTFSVIDLPAQYCRTNFKDDQGNDIVEFNVQYFNSIALQLDRENCLKVYPKEISKYYRKYSAGKVNTPWFKVPTDIGICFPFSDGGLPFFLSALPAILDYDDAVATEKIAQEEQIKKILVQKIPHLNDGTLLFEPDEALEIHRGAVGMLKGNEYTKVLTTYADTESINTKTATEVNNTVLQRMSTNIYTKTGVSGELFNSTSNLALQYSLKNDMSFMTLLTNKYSTFVTNVVNNLYANSILNFKYTILPVTYYNEKDYIDMSFKLASSGYSLLLPAMALGMTQRDLVNIKDLENDLLKLNDKLIPPTSSFNAPAEKNGGNKEEEGDDPKKEEGKNKQVELEDSKPGAREKEEDQKTEKTEKNKESM